VCAFPAEFQLRGTLLFGRRHESTKLQFAGDKTVKGVVMEKPVLELRRLGAVSIPDAPFPELGKPAQQRALRFANAADRDEFVAGRIALRQFAASLLDVDPTRLTPDYLCPQCGAGQDHGRPGFKFDGGPAPVVVSASRALGWVLLAGVVHPAQGMRLGVDLEATEHAAFQGFDEVALTAQEKQHVLSLAESGRDAARARLWARKEAWLKMTGEGLRQDPAEVDVLHRDGVLDLNLNLDSGLDLGPAASPPRTLVAALAVG